VATLTHVSHPIHAILIAFLRAVSPEDAARPDAPTIIHAIETVVHEEKAPVYGSRIADAVILAYTAKAESDLTLGAVGDHGRAFGAYQLHSPRGRGDALTQTRAALEWMRWARGRCPRMPMQAFMSGGCHVATELARSRMRKIMAALKKMQHPSLKELPKE
jgi:hypothetical protein